MIDEEASKEEFEQHFGEWSKTDQDTLWKYFKQMQSFRKTEFTPAHLYDKINIHARVLKTFFFSDEDSKAIAMHTVRFMTTEHLLYLIDLLYGIDHLYWLKQDATSVVKHSTEQAYIRKRFLSAHNVPFTIQNLFKMSPQEFEGHYRIIAQDGTNAREIAMVRQYLTPKSRNHMHAQKKQVEKLLYTRWKRLLPQLIDQGVFSSQNDLKQLFVFCNHNRLPLFYSFTLALQALEQQLSIDTYLNRMKEANDLFNDDSKWGAKKPTPNWTAEHLPYFTPNYFANIALLESNQVSRSAIASYTEILGQLDPTVLYARLETLKTTHRSLTLKNLLQSEESWHQKYHLSSEECIQMFPFGDDPATTISYQKKKA